MRESDLSRRAVLRLLGLGVAEIAGCQSTGTQSGISTTGTSSTVRSRASTPQLTKSETPTVTRTAEERTTTEEQSAIEENQERQEPPYEVINFLTQSMLVTESEWPVRTTVYRKGLGVYQTVQNGHRKKVATISQDLGRPALLCTNAKGHWLLVTGSWRTQGTAYVYRSATDLTRQNPAATLDEVFPPQFGAVMPYWDRTEDDIGFLWGEYHLSSPDTIRIVRASSKGGYSIDPVFDLATPDRRGYLHFHSIDLDSYNPSTLYASTGDPNPNPQFYRSSDYGRTWNPIPKAGGVQAFRTLRMNFGEEYIYWPMDGWDYETGNCHFYRAPRSDLSKHTKIATIGTEQDETLSYGSTRTFDPNGVLVTTRTTKRRTAPLYFYDIGTDKFKKIYSFPTDYDLHHIPGVTAAMPYQNRRTGGISLYLYGIPNPENYSQYWVELDLHQLL